MRRSWQRDDCVCVSRKNSCTGRCRPGGETDIEFEDDEIRQLHFRVTATGARSWGLRFTQFGRRKRMTLGHWPATQPRDARQRAREILLAVDTGKHSGEAHGQTPSDLWPVYWEERQCQLKRPEFDLSIWTRLVEPVIGNYLWRPCS